MEKTPLKLCSITYTRSRVTIFHAIPMDWIRLDWNTTKIKIYKKKTEGYEIMKYTPKSWNFIFRNVFFLFFLNIKTQFYSNSNDCFVCSISRFENRRKKNHFNTNTIGQKDKKKICLAHWKRYISIPNVNVNANAN